MIDEIRVKVSELVREELERSYEKEKTFHSAHEAYAITLEEYEEAEEELRWIEENLGTCWDRVKGDCVPVLGLCKLMYSGAIRGACELIQVAAMCKKWKESEEARYREERGSESSTDK